MSRPSIASVDSIMESMYDGGWKYDACILIRQDNYGKVNTGQNNHLSICFKKFASFKFLQVYLLSQILIL